MFTTVFWEPVPGMVWVRRTCIVFEEDWFGLGFFFLAERGGGGDELMAWSQNEFEGDEHERGWRMKLRVHDERERVGLMKSLS